MACRLHRMNPRSDASLLTPLAHSAPLAPLTAAARWLAAGLLPARAVALRTVPVQAGQVSMVLPLHLRVIFARKPPPRA